MILDFRGKPTTHTMQMLLPFSRILDSFVEFPS